MEAGAIKRNHSNHSVKSTVLISIITLLILPVLLLINTDTAWLCDFTVGQGESDLRVGDTVTFDVDLRITHASKCSKGTNGVVFDMEGMEIQSQTEWQKITSTTYSKQVTVLLTTEGPGVFRVERSATACSKSSDVGMAQFTIAAAPLPEPGPEPGPEPEPEPQPEPEPEPELIPDQSSPPSFAASLGNAMSRPYIIVLFVLTAVATLLVFIGLRKKFRRLRYLTLIASVVYLGFIVGGCPCVFGSIQNIILHLQNDANNIGFYLEDYLVLGIPAFMALVSGRSFCGWVCPMGAIQQFIHRKKIALTMSPRLSNILKYGKYISLIGLIVAVVILGYAAFCNIDLFYSLFNFEVTVVATTILVAVLLLSIFIFTPWCRFLCPLGAFYSLFSRFSIFKMNIGEKCTNCGACARIYCDYNAITQQSNAPKIDRLECTLCGECKARCPKNTIGY